jgi:alkylation response protein AidB-like acyl-CoA dehydrogenase
MGGAQEMLDKTVAFTQERVQFGRAIASFQAIKHKAADMMLKCEVVTFCGVLCRVCGAGSDEC